MQRGHDRMSHPTYPYPFSSLCAFASLREFLFLSLRLCVSFSSH
jgi:hypothetical protein